MKEIYLKRGKEESLLRFHPWIFSGAIGRMDEGIDEGATVRVLTSDGRFAAVGHYQHGSIAVRVLSFDDEDIDEAFWHKRLSHALDVRRALGLADNADTTAYRLVHGEGDMLPGLIIDIYGSTAVVQAHSIGMHQQRMAIATQLVNVMGGSTTHVYYKSEGTLSFVENGSGSLIGSSGATTAKENGLSFYVDWEKGQKTGFFVDQRENRSLLERFAKGRRVLNMFCYTGGFSFYAMRGGAAEVHSVDSSANAIELTRRNVELNTPGDQRHSAFCEDAFRFLDKSETGRYDLIILDPPAFAKHRGALHSALKGYIRLNNKAFEKIASGGILFTFSCSQVVSKDNFRNAVFTAAAQARRKVRILHQLHQPADHPINIYHPEGEYLKGLILYVE
jgi:23S rRNA (cytosine1962-C5)-methyltransferase